MPEQAKPIERKATSKISSVRDRLNIALNKQLLHYNMHRKVLEFFSICEKQMKIFGNVTCTTKKLMDSYNERI